jgi:hypothetical protein
VASEAYFVPFDRRAVFNHGQANPDETATPGSLLTDIHYAQLGLQYAWGKERVLRLCGWLRLTRYELASLIMLPHRQMDEYLKKDVFPGPVCLLFGILEKHFMAGVLPDAIPEDPEEPLIPTHYFDGPSQET